MLTTFGLSEKRSRLNQLRYDLRKLKGHGLLERDGTHYAYRLGVHLSSIPCGSGMENGKTWPRPIPIVFVGGAGE